MALDWRTLIGLLIDFGPMVFAGIVMWRLMVFFEKREKQSLTTAANGIPNRFQKAYLQNQYRSIDQQRLNALRDEAHANSRALNHVLEEYRPGKNRQDFTQLNIAWQETDAATQKYRDELYRLQQQFPGHIRYHQWWTAQEAYNQWLAELDGDEKEHFRLHVRPYITCD